MLFHLFIHSLVDFRMCRLGIEPATSVCGEDALTNWLLARPKNLICVGMNGLFGSLVGALATLTISCRGPERAVRVTLCSELRQQNKILAKVQYLLRRLTGQRHYSPLER